MAVQQIGHVFQATGKKAPENRVLVRSWEASGRINRSGARGWSGESEEKEEEGFHIGYRKNYDKEYRKKARYQIMKLLWG